MLSVSLNKTFPSFLFSGMFCEVQLDLGNAGWILSVTVAVLDKVLLYNLKWMYVCN